MKYKPVLTKNDMVRRYKAGEFGNHSPTWDDPWQMPAVSNPNLRFHARCRIAGGPTYYGLSLTELLKTWSVLRRPWNYYVSGMAPHYANLIQGELREGPTGLELFAAVGYPCRTMRDVLPKAKHYDGIIANSLLRQYLCPNSYDWMMELLQRYPSHVIEFSTFSVNWGTLPNFNTVFWEVRGGY